MGAWATGRCGLFCLLLSRAMLVRAQPPQFFMKGHLDVLSEVDVEAISEHYVALARRYQKEIEVQAAAARYWREAHKSVKQRRMRRVTCKGQVGFVEASMLYIMLREYKPNRTIEIGALCGSSTRWILAALDANGFGHLVTYDLFDMAPQFMSAGAPELLRRWTFIQGDAIEALGGSASPFDADLLFIDALHRNAFAQAYTQRLLRKAAAHISTPLPMFVHDIFSPFIMPQLKPCQRNMTVREMGAEVACIRRVVKQQPAGVDLVYSEKQPTGEGIELMSWLARTSRAKGLVTFSAYAAPRLAKAVGEVLHPTSLGDANNPAIFFELVPDKPQPSQ